MHTGERIKRVRKQARLTQAQLANKAHVSSQVISNWERGYTTPNSEDIKNLAAALKCSVEELLGNVEKTISNNEETEFEAWVNDPEIDKFYREFKESPEERKKALLAVWEVIKKNGN